jgi:hypothetical protein
MRSPAEEAQFNLVCAVESRIGLKVHTDGYLALTEAEKTFYSVWWLDADVNNGGFDQYFFNSYSDHVTDAARGLDLIGAPAAAEIVRSAIGVFPPPGPSADRDFRQDQLDGLSDDAQAKLKALTDAFFERPHDLEHLLATYAISHKLG